MPGCQNYRLKRPNLFAVLHMSHGIGMQKCATHRGRWANSRKRRVSMAQHQAFCILALVSKLPTNCPQRQQSTNPGTGKRAPDALVFAEFRL